MQLGGVISLSIGRLTKLQRLQTNEPWRRKIRRLLPPDGITVKHISVSLVVTTFPLLLA
jgi:hypothetical protein